MLVLVQTIGDACGGTGDQKRAPNVCCVIGRRAATAVVTKLLSTAEVREFNGEKLCADTRSAVDPKSILRKQFGECQIARRRLFWSGEQLIPAFPVQRIL